MTTDSNVVENIFKTKEGYNECDHCQSVLSPAAYFIKLMETVDKYIVQPDHKKSLKLRRPDLYSELKLDCDNTNKEKLYLEIVNDVMLKNLESSLGGNTLKKLATAKYPLNLPANLPLVSVRAYLKEHNTSLTEIYKALLPDADTTLEDLEFSPEAHQEIISTDAADSYLKEVYGIDQSSALSQLNTLDKFIAQTDVEHDKLQVLFDSYNKVKEFSGSAGLSIDRTSKIIKNLNQALGFLHRFIRLANKLNWSFDELSNVLIAIGQKEIDSGSIKQIAKIKNLQKRFKQPITKIAELYSQADIWSKKVESLQEFKSSLNGNYRKLQELAKDANSQSALQSILSINSNELTSLIEYNDSKGSYSQTGKSLLFEVYKQVLLARLIGVPVAQFMELLSLLNTSELSADNIERVIELDDWLKEHSITAEQVKRLINLSTFEKELRNKINQEVGEDAESFYNVISEYVKIQPDMLFAVHEFTKKYEQPQHLTERLLHNITVFSELKLSADDVDNITKHREVYALNGKWPLEQIKTLVNYKLLKGIFSNNSLTLPQYIDWLNGGDYSEGKVIEKIVQLTKWNGDVLENIKKIRIFTPYFTKNQNPINSLLKIKSIMDVVIRSGVNSAVLLELRHLHDLKVDNDNKWKKYTDAAGNLELSARSEAKDRAIKHLAEQKRDVLARYMVYKLKLRNMRDLYSHLLIDVEMSDCSKISPLKAALNSVQLYIHRSMMRLEKGITIKQGLDEEKWKWLSNYREWEASNKIKLYPENYLDPTLRSIATPEYKTLQSTLMQGNITDEAVSDAYMKYFEGFEQVTSLKIVDSCFEKVVDKASGIEKNTLFIIGRMLAKPYMYYHRTAVFDTLNQKILYWTAWEKIEALIPAETVTPIYAFDRLFLFWVQTNEKKEVNIIGTGSSKKINPNLPLSDNPEVTINYIFQRPSGSWSAQQELASNVKVNPVTEVNKLHWKKVAAFYLTEKGGEERRIVITIGEIKAQSVSGANPTSLFTLDEDLVTYENQPGHFFDTSYNTSKPDDTRDLSCDIDKNGRGKLTLHFTKNVFKSNITNKENNAEFLGVAPQIELLSKFKVSTVQQVINKPGWFIVEGNLEHENVRESFLLLPKWYDISAISHQSTYESASQSFKFQYLSDIPRVPLNEIEFAFIRLNITGNIRKLRQKAYAGGPKRILTLESQKIEQLKLRRFQPKDAVISYPPDHLDFNGAYAIYLWEIFFHVPTLIALHLNQEQEFAKARKWYQYILNPTNDDNQTWQFLPFTKHNTESIANALKNTQTIQELEIDPFDPYVIAKQRATAFEKYVIIRYIDNLIDWGDMLLAKKSWEAINQATMLYIRAWDLLGRKPIKQEKLIVEAQTFEKLASNQQSGNLLTLCRLETELPATGRQSSFPEQSCTRAQSADEVYDMTKYGYYFCKPENKDFIDLWSRVEDCLHKIRHCLDSEGKRLVLPLFQAPIDPRQLIQTYASASRGSVVAIPSVSLPHYRFSYMINYAKSVVETVMQFGSELLGVLEKKDAEALNILYNKQEGIISNLMTSIKEKAIEALKEEGNALGKSFRSAEDRELHYKDLIKKGLLNQEKEAIGLSSTSVETRDGASITKIVAAVSHLIPTVFGLACAAFKPGDVVEAGASSAESRANVLDGKSGTINTNASYKRRDEDWELQEKMACHDAKQITHQMEANKINQANAEQDLKVHKESIKQIKEKEEFFRSKFSNQELYHWMKGQIASIYFQAYKMALEVAKQAEKTYQYELNNNKEFITNSSWNSLKEGLLAGNSLKFTLEQIAKSYNEENKRTLEISKIVSLGQLDPMALHNLRTSGSCEFSLTERLFDWDFPGHYCRKIKSIKITIPAVVGPYENIHASLQQTSNKIVMKPDINAVKFLLGEASTSRPENSTLRENWQPNQEIAVSRGDQDSGLFELNFNDERYLPFEGTGAISNWKLNLPESTNRFDTSTISDVIIQIDYTALDDGRLGEQVKRLPKLENYHGTLVINLSKAYPDSWERLKQTQGQLIFNPSFGMFPSYAKNPELDGNYIYFVPKISNEASSTPYKLNTSSKRFAIGSDWDIDISSIPIANIEEMTVVIPYKTKINWQSS